MSSLATPGSVTTRDWQPISREFRSTFAFSRRFRTFATAVDTCLESITVNNNTSLFANFFVEVDLSLILHLKAET